MHYLAYDTETTGLYPHHGDNMFAYSTTDENWKSVVQRLDGSELRQIRGKKKLAQLWADEKKKSEGKVAHNLKFDLSFTEKALGKRLDGHEAHCTHKMSHILQNHHYDHSLDHLAWELAEYPRIDAKMKRLGKLCGGYKNVPEDKMSEYQKHDTERGMLLFKFFYPKILANPQYREIYQTEIDLIWATMRMEQRGLKVDSKRTNKMIANLRDDILRVREDLFARVGRRFNPNSDPELRKVLYRDLALPVLKRTGKTKEASTDKHVLLRLREEHPHPIIENILKLRAYSKGVKALESYLELSDNDDVLHPTINTCGAITGRESSEHPNLQNVQKTGVLLNPYPVPAREAFRPRPGYILVFIDYAGIEMRLLVHYAEEPKMLECLNHGDGDVHSLAASVFYGSRFTDLSIGSDQRSSLRSAAKNANFAIPYGAGAAKVAQTLGLLPARGMAAYKRYKSVFPRLCGLTKTVSSWVFAEGYVQTVFGRKLHVSKAKAHSGTNYLIQGTAAGVLKRAQNRVHKYNEHQTGGEVKLLLPIHDEIVLEFPRNRLGELNDYLRDVRRLMIDFPQFNVPMDIGISISTYSWEHKKKLAIKE